MNTLQRNIISDLKKSRDNQVSVKLYGKGYDAVAAICGLAILEMRIGHLNKITKQPPEPYTRHMMDGKNKLVADVGNYHLSECYGGVSLHQMASVGGSVTCPLGSYHMPKWELLGKLDAFINGIEARL